MVCAWIAIVSKETLCVFAFSFDRTFHNDFIVSGSHAACVGCDP